VDLRNANRTRSRIGPSNEAAPATLLASAAALASQGRYVTRGVAVSNEPIRVILVDDHGIVRDGLKAVLRSASNIQVVGEAANGRDAIALVERTAPDVVVMDLTMPGGDGETATLELSRLKHPPKILILTMHTEEERLVPLLKDGARGYLSKDCADHDLIDAIRVVAAGEFFVRPAVARILAADAIRRRNEPPLQEDQRKFESLSGRERAVLQRVAEGYSGVEIGRMLDITPKTVDTYKNRIGVKLGLAHRTDYVRFAMRLGLMSDDGRQHTADEMARLNRPLPTPRRIPVPSGMPSTSTPR
jgi:DNA-binding NarL/FixJ family response regulator